MKPIPQPFARSQVERLIAVARIALAASSLFGIWLDPAEPARYADFTYTLHAVYLAYAFGLAAIMWRRDSSGRLPIITHLTDRVFFTDLAAIGATRVLADLEGEGWLIKSRGWFVAPAGSPLIGRLRTIP